MSERKVRIEATFLYDPNEIPRREALCCPLKVQNCNTRCSWFHAEELPGEYEGKRYAYCKEHCIGLIVEM